MEMIGGRFYEYILKMRGSGLIPEGCHFSGIVTGKFVVTGGKGETSVLDKICNHTYHALIL